jgi:hypothetical protein
MEPEEILHEIRNDIREKFDNDIYIMRTVNMVVLEFERRNKQLKQHSVSNCADTKGGQPRD